MRYRFFVVFVLLLMAVLLSACDEVVPGGSDLSESDVKRNVQRVFPGANDIEVDSLRQCEQNKENYEAFVSYTLYDPLFNRYTPFAEWYLFWSPYDENSFFRGRCN